MFNYKMMSQKGMIIMKIDKETLAQITMEALIVSKLTPYKQACVMLALDSMKKPSTEKVELFAFECEKAINDLEKGIMRPVIGCTNSYSPFYETVESLGIADSKELVRVLYNISYIAKSRKKGQHNCA